MTRALLRHRIETKLLAQAAADKVGGSPSVTDAQIQAQYDKDKKTTYAQPERRKLRHILVKTKALADQLYAQLSSSDASFAELAKKYSTDSSKATAATSASSIARPRQAVRRCRVHAARGRRLAADEDPVRLAPDRGRGAGPAQEYASARRGAQGRRSAASSPRRQRQKHIAQQFDRGRDRAEPEHRVRAGLRAAVAAPRSDRRRRRRRAL